MHTLEPAGDTRRPKTPSPMVAAWAVAVIVVVGALGFYLPRLSSPSQAAPPFDTPVAALQALASSDAEEWTDLADLFIPAASIDAFGRTRPFDSPGMEREHAFWNSLGARVEVEECSQIDGRGECSMIATDDLLVAVGLEGVTQEWTATLDDGRIATLQQDVVDDSPLTREANEWFVDFNQWICRNHPDEGRAELWDPLLTVDRFATPDCGSTDWAWEVGSGADPDVARNLHVRYLESLDG